MEQYRSSVSSSFTSKIDSKGRALLNSEIRKKLQLRFGTSVKISCAGKSFITKLDERGRFNVPAFVRKNTSEISGYVTVLFENGRGGETKITADCGFAIAGESPACGPLRISEGVME